LIINYAGLRHSSSFIIFFLSLCDFYVPMLQRFIKNIEDNHLFAPNDTILVGVSGGIDSVVLLDLLDKAGYSIGIAHCNFRLRAGDSDADEDLVENLAVKYDKTLYKNSFDTKEYSEENGISVEMAARELRYNWFEEIRFKHHYNWISVAHHRDDQLETFFLNLARGTGLSGLTGMKPVNGKIVRPLLFASRKEITEYSKKNFLDYREDASNENTEIQRNKIRHMVIPLMEELNPSFRDGLIKTMGNLHDVNKIQLAEIRNAWERIALRKGNDYYLSIAELKLLDPLITYLYEFLKPFHFKTEVVGEIVSSLDSISGKQFLSRSNRLVRDRESLIVTSLVSDDRRIYYLDESTSELSSPLKMKVSIIERKYKYEIPDSPRTACIDIDKVQFPLIIRHWEKGDYFKPLGMSGIKKLSDFFVDQKMSLPEKENAWILANGEQVAWIIGKRLDDRFKITSKTKNILMLELIG
jgi:tRNA(Ile)-lysidine synthase